MTVELSPSSAYAHAVRGYRMLKINPDYSIEQRGEVLPYKDPADWDRIVDGLAKAGLPD